LPASSFGQPRPGAIKLIGAVITNPSCKSQGFCKKSHGTQPPWKTTIFLYPSHEILTISASAASQGGFRLACRTFSAAHGGRVIFQLPAAAPVIMLDGKPVFAERAGIKQPSLASLEGRKSTPRITTLMKLAKAMDLSVEQLIESMNA